VEGQAGVPVVVQFYRWDRENDLDPSVLQTDHYRFDHSYGDEIDRVLDELVGGDGFDRSVQWPTREVPGTGITVTLHEDGPMWQFLIEQLPVFITAATGAFTTWMAWRSAREERRSRSTRIEVRGHSYAGPITDPEQLATVARTLAALPPEGDDASSD
jgi:hypothetical protein